MTERGRLDPGVGYWAEQWDPEGRLHPLYSTVRIGHRWVQVTTLPVLYLGWPLYRLGGYRLALLLPMVGSVLAALAARALARRIAPGESDGWAAFWIVGLASPLAIYALDFWEHSLGVAAMAWAVVLLLDLVEWRRRWPVAGAAGALFGAAATMRTEALVYAVVTVGAACLLLLVRRRRPAAAVGAGLIAVLGLAAVVAANYALELATAGGSIRFGRASGTASSAVSTAGDVAGTRLEEAALTAVSLHPSLEPSSYLVGVALLGLLVFVALRARGEGDAGPVVVAAVGVGALYLIRFTDGLGFVPGLVATTPLAALALARGWGPLAARVVLGTALVALPVVWATQYQGGAPPQWGGRYILTSGFLLGTVGVTAMAQLHPWARRAFVGLAIAVTAFGLAWTWQRTHQFAQASRALDRRDEPVLVSTVGHLHREGGSYYGDRRWLTAVHADDRRLALAVLEGAGVSRFGLVSLEGESPALPTGRWRETGRDRVPLFPDLDLEVVTYEAQAAA